MKEIQVSIVSHRRAGSAGVELAVDGFGDPSAPPALLLHGGGQTRHSWAGTA